MIWFTLFILALTAAYIYLRNCYNYWRNAGVQQTNPKLFFGDILPIYLKSKTVTEWSTDLYNQAAGKRYFGFYQMTTPTLAIVDIDLIKQIGVKDFNHFTDHRTVISPEVEPFFGRNLFALRGKKWNHMRMTLSPSFTSSKMKFMYSLFKETANDFVNHFLQKNQNAIELNMSETFRCFTNDVIASSAFGLKVDSLEDMNNDFYAMGKKITDVSGYWIILKILFNTISPRLCRFFNITILDKNVTDFFITTIKRTMEERREKQIVRPDMVHILMQAQKGNQKTEKDETAIDTGFATVQEQLNDPKFVNSTEITDIDIASQAMIFFFAGFDAVSNLMSFTAYELAMNPEIQTKLREEINNAFDENNGDVTYDVLLQMKYLDMVISETLRKWPNNTATDRVCTKPYTIQPLTPEEQPVHLKEGDLLWFPIFPLQRDPKYYPDPEKFDPERFNDENKKNINAYTFLPFGLGPRNCIGSRFALLQTKTILVNVLRHFEISFSEKMKLPLTLDKKQFTLSPEGGFWLNLNRLSVE